MKDNRMKLIVVLLVIFICMSLFVTFKKSGNIAYIGSNTKILITKDGFTIKNDSKKLNLTKAKIYFNGDFIDGYLKSDVSNNKVVYNAYDQNGNILRFNDALIAYTGNKEIKVAHLSKLELMEEKDVNNIAKYLYSDEAKLNLFDYSIDYNNYEKYIYDIDNDGDKEIIYNIDISVADDKNYTFVLLYDNDEIKVVDKESGNVGPETKKISFTNLIDFNNDGIYEIIIKEKQDEYVNAVYKLYNYDSKVNEIK